jgi:hypothetical protein
MFTTICIGVGVHCLTCRAGSHEDSPSFAAEVTALELFDTSHFFMFNVEPAVANIAPHYDSAYARDASRKDRNK